MPFDFTNKVIAVSGAASGIGLATAQLLYASGALLSLTDVREEALKAAIHIITNDTNTGLNAELQASSSDRTSLPTPGSKLGECILIPTNERILAITANVSDSAQVNNWIGSTIDKFGRIDGAANMAGVSSRGAGMHNITKVTDEDWKFIVDINLTGTFYALRAQLRAMEASGVKLGSIVNCSSIYGVEGKENSGDYAATKHGVVGLTRSVAKEFGGKGIRVNCVAPGIINTPMVQNLSDQFLESHKRTLQYSQALHRMAEPSEIAKINAFLLSEDSSFVTGACYLADGGQVC